MGRICTVGHSLRALVFATGLEPEVSRMDVEQEDGCEVEKRRDELEPMRWPRTRVRLSLPSRLQLSPV